MTDNQREFTLSEINLLKGKDNIPQVTIKSYQVINIKIDETKANVLNITKNDVDEFFRKELSSGNQNDMDFLSRLVMEKMASQYHYLQLQPLASSPSQII